MQHMGDGVYSQMGLVNKESYILVRLTMACKRPMRPPCSSAMLCTCTISLLSAGLVGTNAYPFMCWGYSKQRPMVTGMQPTYGYRPGSSQGQTYKKKVLSTQLSIHVKLPQKLKNIKCNYLKIFNKFSTKNLDHFILKVSKHVFLK